MPFSLCLFMLWGCIGPVHAGVGGNEINDQLAGGGSAVRSVGPEPALGVSGHDIRRRTRRWLVNQHWVWGWGLGNTQRQARELISGPNPKSISLNASWIF
jgi:hypothetical protein